jgi:hypothetical protein
MPFAFKALDKTVPDMTGKGIFAGMTINDKYFHVHSISRRRGTDKYKINCIFTVDNIDFIDIITIVQDYKMGKQWLYLAGILVFFFSLPLWAQENRRNMDNHIPDFVEQRFRLYNRAVKSLAEIYAPDNYFNEYFLKETNLDRSSLSGSTERRHLIYSSGNNGNIDVIMTLFSTPQSARNGLIAMAENYEKNKSRRYWMPWTYNRAIFIGDMYAVSNISASLFARNNVVVDIAADRSIIEVIAGEIDWEICQGELDHIVNNMAFENHSRLIQSLD